MREINCKIVERIYATGIWESSSPLHIGGGDGDGFEAADMLLLRGSQGFFIPAGSIAGATRSLLRGSGDEAIALEILFGGGTTGNASPLMISDASCEGVNPSPIVRDSVKIDSRSGCATDHAKFNIELLPTGSRFRFAFVLLVFDEWRPKTVRTEHVLAWFHALIDEFESGKVYLGARTRRGYGRGRVEKFNVHRLRMDNRQHVAAWLRQKPDEIPLTNDLPPAIRLQTRRQFSIEAKLRLRTSLLVRHAGSDPADPDFVHLTESDKAILPATSLAGAIRHRCERIARTLMTEEQATRIIKEMFGPELGKGRDKDSLARAGRVWVSEASLQNGECLVQGRVSIDRFTGGALEARLFNEGPFWPSGSGTHHLDIHIELENPSPDETGLLLQAFKDLWLGDLPLGGEASIGRGVFEGVTATLFHTDAGSLTLSTRGIDPAGVDVDKWNLFRLEVPS